MDSYKRALFLLVAPLAILLSSTLSASQLGADPFTSEIEPNLIAKGHHGGGHHSHHGHHGHHHGGHRSHHGHHGHHHGGHHGHGNHNHHDHHNHHGDWGHHGGNWEGGNWEGGNWEGGGIDVNGNPNWNVVPNGNQPIYYQNGSTIPYSYPYNTNYPNNVPYNGGTNSGQKVPATIDININGVPAGSVTPSGTTAPAATHGQ